MSAPEYFQSVVYRDFDFLVHVKRIRGHADNQATPLLGLSPLQNSVGRRIHCCPSLFLADEVFSELKPYTISKNTIEDNVFI